MTQSSGLCYVSIKLKERERNWVLFINQCEKGDVNWSFLFPFSVDKKNQGIDYLGMY